MQVFLATVRTVQTCLVERGLILGGSMDIGAEGSSFVRIANPGLGVGSEAVGIGSL